MNEELNPNVDNFSNEENNDNEDWRDHNKEEDNGHKEKDVQLIDKSFKPFFTKLTTSFLLD